MDNASVPTLAELITDRKAVSGLSYDQLAAKTDYVLTRQRFQQLGKGLRITEFPEPATLEAVALALDVDVALVVLATAKSIGLSVETGSRSNLAMMLPAAAKNLTDEQVNALLALIRSIVTEQSPARDVPARGDQLQNPSWGPTYVATDGPSVSGDQDRDQRHKLSGG